MQPPLHEILESAAPRIVERFVADVRATELPARPLTREQIVDHLREYVVELAALLRDEVGAGRVARNRAREHAGQRWSVGYDLKTVLLEYDVLREAILAELEATGVQVGLREFDKLVHLLNLGIADAAGGFMEHTTTQLHAALQRARLATEAREDVLGVVSHDLRGPLQVIYTSAKLLRDHLGADQAAASDLLDRVERAARKMELLIGDLLELARLRAGETSLRLEPHPVSELLDEACEHSAPLAEPRHVRLERSRLDPGTIRCDRNRIYQVLCNLISNAIKFSHKGGLVTVSACRSEPAWTFSVKDTGDGIPADRVGMIFDRFWQSGEGGGTGLGLSIAKALVELHGGRIWVESTPGAGTEFHFTLPH